MKTRRPNGSFLWVGLFLLAGVQNLALRCAEETKSDKDGGLPKELTEALGWLPADTESLFVARGPFVAPSIEEGASDQSKGLAFPRLWLAGGELLCIQEGKLYSHLKGVSVAWVVFGCRHFGESGDIPGRNTYEGAQVLCLAEHTEDKSKKLWEALAKAADRTQKENEEPILEFDNGSGRQAWPVFVAHPAPNLWLWGTQLKFVTAILSRRKSETKDRALPDELPEWKYVDAGAPLWGLRHFDPKAGNKDWGTMGKELKPVGMAFHFCSGGKEEAVIHQLFDNDKFDALSKDVWGDLKESGLKPRVETLEPGRTKVTIPLGEKGAAFSLFWFVATLMGPGFML